MALSEYLLDQLFIGNTLRKEGYRGRYAPSPTGPLHIGNLRTALLSWLRARLSKGIWLLRIDDLDSQRNRQGSVESIQDDLHWLGLNWDGPVIFQSHRRVLYSLIISKLRSENKIYACRCSRKAIAEANESSNEILIYPGTCRYLGLSWNSHGQRLPSLRLKVAEEYLHQCGDIILRRSDGVFAYNLATVADDLTMGITEVVRGEDLKLALPSQLALFKALNQPPMQYNHVPIVCDKNGAKLSKRFGGFGVQSLKERGIKPSEIIGSFASSLGLLPYKYNLSAIELLNELMKKKNPLEKIFKSK